MSREADVVAFVADRAARFGYDVFALGAPPRGKDFAGYFHSTWPQHWLDLYVAEGLVASDPMPLAAAVNLLPFTWSDLVAGRAGITLTEDQLRAPRLGADHGWREGLCVPIHGPGAMLALASFGGAAPDTSAAAVDELQLLSVHAHVRLSALSHARKPLAGADSFGLTDREIEALACAFGGLTDKGIAAKMCITERTARFHLDNAREKLGARSPTQAVAKALSLGLLTR